MLSLSFENQIYLFIGLLLILLAMCFILIIVLSLKLEKTLTRQDNIDKHIKKESVDVLLEKCLKRQDELSSRINDNRQNIKELAENSKKAFDKIDIVRYSSSPNDENNLNFSIGITNMEKNGIIITGLQTEYSTKMIVKKVKKGIADEDTTVEETAVIKREE